jgi:YD repeat-containing protein
LSASETATVVYSYAAQRIYAASMPGFAPGGVAATWGFTLSGSQLQSVHYPHPASIPERVTAIALDSAAASGTVSYRARVELASADTTVAETYRFDPTGRQIARGIPSASAASRQGTDTVDYAASGMPRHCVSAAGVVTDAVTDARGNEMLSSDVEGHTTTSAFNALDDVTSTTDPRGAVTSYIYNAAGDVTFERSTADAAHSSETSSTYDSQGRLLTQGQLIDAATGGRSYTTYSYGASFATPVATVKHDAALSSTCTLDLTSTQTLDEFGQVICATDDAGAAAGGATFDSSGRAVSETDAAGAVTHHRYDLLGAEVETSRTASTGAWCDWTRGTVDPTGLVLSEQSFVLVSGAPAVYRIVTHTFDGSGRELAAGASDEGTATTRYDAKGGASYTWAPSAETTAVAEAMVVKTDADGRTTNEAAPAGGWTGSQDNSVQETSTTTFIPGDMEVTATDPSDEDTTTYEYDEDGNQTQIETPDDGGGTVSATVYRVNFSGHFRWQIGVRARRGSASSARHPGSLRAA